MTREPVFPVILEFQHPAINVVGFAPISLGLSCMLRVSLYRKGAIVEKKRGIGNIIYRWWRNLECPKTTTGQPQVTDSRLTYR